nr:retrovirus-related Pol polyprotein from transposon TNT 1-94 [Tanacetum cinerariifolium]
MRIEQYFLMTDYSLWEVILNGDSPVPTRVVDGVLQPVAPTTAEQRLARKNELKAHGTTIQNLAFMSSSNTDSTTEPVSAAASVFAVCAKIPQLDNEDLKQIDADDLEEMDLKWECRSPKDSRRNGAAEPQKRNVLVKTSTSNALVSQCNESDESWPPSSLYDRFQSSDGYHVVLPPYTGTFMPPKPDLVFTNAPNDVETDHSAFNDESEIKPPQTVPSFVQSTEQVKSPRHSVQHVETFIPAATPKPSSPKPTSNGKRRNRKACFVCKSLDHLIKIMTIMRRKWLNPLLGTMHTGSKSIPIIVVRPISTVVPKIKVTRPRHATPIVTKTNSPTRKHITRSPSQKASNSSPRVTTVKDPVVNAALDSLLPIPFWAEAVNTACYVQNRVLVTKPHNKTPYELLHGRTPSIGFMRPFGCHVTILNTLDSLGKFDGKVDEGFLVGYSEPEFNEKKPKSKVNVSSSSSAQSKKQDDKTKREAKGKRYRDLSVEFEDFSDNNINEVNAPGTLVPLLDASQLLDDPDMPELEDITYSDDEDDVGAEADFNNLETSITVSPIPTIRVHKDHHKVWVLVDLSYGKRAIGTKWVFKNKKDERGIVFRNKARLIAQGHTPEKGIDYKEVFAPVALIEAIRLFLAYASFMGFIVYQMDVKSAFLYGTIKEEVYVCQPPGFEDPDHPDKVYKVVKHFMVYIKLLELDDIIFGAINKDLCKSFEKLMKDKFQMSSVGELTFFLGIQVKQKKDGIFISQDKYVAEILRKFRLTDEKSSSTPIDTEKPLQKDPDGKKVDVHTYRSMIGSLMYLTSSRPDIMFADSPFDLVAYSDCDYAGASLDRKSTTRGCQFLRCRLISWQCKKQTVVATSSTKAEYVAVASCSKWYGVFKKDVTCYKYLKCWFTYLTTNGSQFTMSNPHQELASPDQKVSGKDSSDPLMADNLPKVIWYSTHHVALMKSWIVQKQMALGQTTTGKEISNPFMCMSAKRTSWNKFSSSMASAVICLSSGDLSTHTTKYTSPALTQKVFANIRRVGKGFSGVDTPLFEGMLVEQQVVEEGDADENDENVNAGDTTEGDVSAAHDEVPTVSKEPSIPSLTPPTPPPQPSYDIPSTSQVQPTPPQSPQRVKKLERRNKVRVLKLRTTQRVETSDETVMDGVSNQGRMIAEMDQDADVVLEDDKEVVDAVKDVQDDIDKSAQDQGRKAKSKAEIYKIDLEHANKVLSMQENESEPTKVQEVVEVVTTAKIITEVVTAASETITAASTTITATEAQVPAAILTAAPARVTAAPSRRRKGVDKGKGILVEEPKPLKKKKQIKQDKKYARELEAELNKNIDWDEVIDHVKKKAKEDPAVKKYQALKRKLQTEAQARKNMMLYLKNVDGFKMDYFKGMSYDDICPIFKAKFNTNMAFLLKTKEQIEEEESIALKRLNETPAEKAAKRQKLDEEVEDLKRHLQIVPNEDDDVYTKATSLARKVPVVDYEIIEQNNKPYYKIIRADDTYQLQIYMLKSRRIKEVYMVQKSKGLEAIGIMWCVDHYIYNHTADFVSRKEVPTTRFTLDQMLNAVRLEVKEESEVSLELLRFIRQQHQEGQLE